MADHEVEVAREKLSDLMKERKTQEKLTVLFRIGFIIAEKNGFVNVAFQLKIRGGNDHGKNILYLRYTRRIRSLFESSAQCIGNDSCISAISVSILWCDFCKQLIRQINCFCISLSSGCLLGNINNRIQNSQYLTSCMSSGRKIFFDFLLLQKLRLRK